MKDQEKTEQVNRVPKPIVYIAIVLAVLLLGVRMYKTAPLDGQITEQVDIETRRERNEWAERQLSEIEARKRAKEVRIERRAREIAGEQ